ncbi:hypothetical protein EST38_g14154 [Candolleomyces aberdarensis]|uniref:Uncharacterized protein n=1 Tax=Candolleomyces aberdarensis TaxID=2316362 RepID=A0A4Q2D0F3_9AGAR|nr:hypothetical protein EST38_g14154 [Candolleomyces aberdarensis]
MHFTRVVFAAVLAVFAGSSLAIASPIPAPAPVPEAQPQACQILNSCG